MRIVMKFGGVSVSDGPRMLHAARLICGYQRRNEVVAVISALQGVTSTLQEAAVEAADSGRPHVVRKVVGELSRRHLSVCGHIPGGGADVRPDRGGGRLQRPPGSAEAGGASSKKMPEGSGRADVEGEVRGRLGELENGLMGICHLGEVTDRSLDYIRSFGERLAAPLLAGMVRGLDVEAVSLTGGEAGVHTDGRFGNAAPLAGAERQMARRLGPLLRRGVVPVVAGYIGAGPGGRVTTLGRGGSDYTATLLGAALGADEVWLWKETDGVMSADPRVVEGARTLGHMSYEEAMELSYFGAQVLHPRAMEPVIRRSIPVRVKNVFHPEAPGTLIRKHPPRGGRGDGRVVKAIATIRDVALLNLAGAGMVGAPGSAGRIFSALGGAGVNVIMISQGSSERAISLLIEAGHVERALEALRGEFAKNLVGDISWDEGVCAVAAVGSGMRGTPGVAGRVFSALGRAGVNVMMIAQGSSEYNISLVVRRAQMEQAVRALHREFAMDR